MKEKPAEEAGKSMAQNHKEMLREKYGIEVSPDAPLSSEAEKILSAEYEVEKPSSKEDVKLHEKKLAEKDLDYLIDTLKGSEKEEITKVRDYLAKKGHSKDKIHGIIRNMIGE